jgi:SAM-dependent methyltransferase
VATPDIPDIPVIRGRIPNPWEKEYRELQHYESGQAESDAQSRSTGAAEPWEEVIRQSEPSAFPAVARLMADPSLTARIKGTVIDVGAGTCFFSAELSKRADVERVYAVDLSEKFLTTVGARVLRHFGARLEKIQFVASDFNDIPLPAATVDAAFLFASIHHSLAPIKTLQEVARLVKPGGTIFILENPKSVMGIRKAREVALALSDDVSEVTYTRGELEYLIATANVGRCETIRFDVLSRPGPRRWIRAAVRLVGLEDVILNPPNYLFVITRK